ncbi:metal dependent phosphohydrolase [Paenibacillus curdlanolyticus YK9]|uniref:Metal dependent phosphohydrolase n=1 Tax=Paenibacillus curdlanolyticus YK9 TaxID=717606 RepID=E0I9T6_9BACL|nr:HD-GYP domain-containing protein [Paenibacillus curdlanolyticus]EFM10513.1 metal dependent phosphohydrolase [Paenibacillus curdlanolyticus YK9]
MRKVSIQQIKPGNKLAKPILQENGNVLLGAGVELNERFIERLRSLGIDMLFVEDEFTEDLEPPEAIQEATRQKAVNAIYQTTANLKDQSFMRGRTVAPEMGRTLKQVFGEIMNDVIVRDDVMVNLTNIHVTDAYLYQHAVNVAILSGIIGIAKGFNRQQLEELGIGALLFDIGMTKVPAELINKDGPLTPAEKALVERHTTEGFDILRKQHDISLLSAHCALQHHERFDGSGYPRGLKQDEIHLYAQIVGIADVYDALTSPRPHRKRHTPSEAIEFLFASGSTYFDYELVKLFCKHISVYPVATTVLLNTGQIGVVSANNSLAVHRPTVRIVEEADGSRPSSVYEIDLKNEVSILIVKEL